MELETFVSRGLKAQSEVDEIIATHATNGTNNRPASLNPTRFLNRAEVRKFLLAHAAATRPANRFSRVSEMTLVDLNEKLRALMTGFVHRAPSRGRTL